MKIMLIDDQMNVIQSLKEAIDPKGHECFLYDNPVDAVARFKTEAFDAVITDMKMPKMNGIEVVNTIHKFKPGTPVIILTGYANKRNAIDAVNSGVYAFYEKPINIKMFMNTMLKMEKELIARQMAESYGIIPVDEKDMVLKEMHHRIKNDLYVISKMIDVQSRNLYHPEVIGILTGIKDLISSISNSHNSLTYTSGLYHISMPHYLHSLIRDLYSKFKIQTKEIKIDLKIDEFVIPKHVASYLGILVNEIVTNSIKHAFQDSSNKENNIRISLLKEKDEILLAVSDNGIGLPKGFNRFQSNSLGFYLIRTISEDLLGGTIQIENNKGTKFIFRLNTES